MRTQVEKLSGSEVYPDLRVKLAKNWSCDPKHLGQLRF